MSDRKHAGPESYRIDKYNLRRIDWDFGTEPLGLLCIWEGPKPNHRYVIGVDCAEGLAQNRSCIEVNRVGTLHTVDEQVAEWCGNVNALELAPILYAIGKLYTQGGDEPMIAIERAAGGDLCQQELRMRYDWGYLYQYRTYNKIAGGWAQRYGWDTNVETRPKLLQRAIQKIKNCQWQINSPWLVDELSSFEYDAIKMKMKAATGCQDDRVMAAFISLYCSGDIYDLDPDATATESSEARSKAKAAIPWQATDISVEEIENYGTDGYLFS